MGLSEDEGMMGMLESMETREETDETMDLDWIHNGLEEKMFTGTEESPQEGWGWTESHTMLGGD